MARKYRTHITEKKAVEITVQVLGLEEYKNAWLSICNNAREYPCTIYKVHNSYNSNIYVLCNPESADNSREWLEQFGKIVGVDNDKVAVFVDVTCDHDDFDKDWVDSEYVFGELE